MAESGFLNLNFICVKDVKKSINKGQLVNFFEDDIQFIFSISAD